ncbi:MAG: hypothetical protein ABFD83_14750 [Armatimonadota bacterium]
MKVNLTKTIALIGTLPTIVSSVKELVTEFEDDKSTGVEKKATVLKALEIGMETGTMLLDVQLPTEAVMAIAGKLIDLIVEVKNRIGEFTHKSATATATAVIGTAAAQ